LYSYSYAFVTSSCLRNSSSLVLTRSFALEILSSTGYNSFNFAFFAAISASNAPLVVPEVELFKLLSFSLINDYNSPFFKEVRTSEALFDTNART